MLTRAPASIAAGVAWGQIVADLIWTWRSGDGWNTAPPTFTGSTAVNAVTHGCMRLSDPDIEWLYRHVPVGTHVYIYD